RVLCRRLVRDRADAAAAHLHARCRRHRDRNHAARDLRVLSAVRRVSNGDHGRVAWPGRHAIADADESGWPLADRPAGCLPPVLHSGLGRDGPVGRSVDRPDPDWGGVAGGLVARGGARLFHTMTRMWRTAIGAVAVAGLIVSCARTPPAPTPAEVASFLKDVNAQMLELGVQQQQADWVNATYITSDTEAIRAVMDRTFLEAMAKFAKAATRFDHVQVSPAERRQLDLLKLALDLVPPSDSKDAAELTRLGASLESTYGRGKWCRDATK